MLNLGGRGRVWLRDLFGFFFLVVWFSPYARKHSFLYIEKNQVKFAFWGRSNTVSLSFPFPCSVRFCQPEHRMAVHTWRRPTALPRQPSVGWQCACAEGGNGAGGGERAPERRLGRRPGGGLPDVLKWAVSFLCLSCNVWFFFFFLIFLYGRECK